MDLPKGTFTKSPAVEWLCDETDPRVGADKLHAAIVSGAPRGAVTDSMKIFSRIGWYAMPVFAVVRVGCCPGAKDSLLASGDSVRAKLHRIENQQREKQAADKRHDWLRWIGK